MPYAISPAPVWKPWVRSPVWVSAGNMLMMGHSGILAHYLANHAVHFSRRYRPSPETREPNA